MKKIDKKTLIILIATVALALVAVATAWRFYDLRRQAISPTAPKLVPAQEPSSSCTVSFTVGGAAGACPVNPVCCLEPITACTNTLQCGAGYICYFGYCVKQTYDSAANTCPNALPRPQPVGSGGEDGGGGAGGTGGTTPAVSPRPSPSPSPSPSASPSPGVSPSPSAGTSPQPGSSSPSPSSSQTSQSPGSSTSAPSGTAKTAETQLPQAGAGLPTIAIGAGGILILVIGILLAF